MAIAAFGLAAAAFSGLGMSQMMWQKLEMQKVSDVVARQAASQMGDGPAFEGAMQTAIINGAKPGEVSIQCQNSSNAPTACSEASRVQVTTTRKLKPLFFSGERTVVAVSQAIPAPLVSGTISSGLVSVNTAQSALLNRLVGAIGGGSINIDAVTWRGLINSTSTVSLLDLSLALNAASAKDLVDLRPSLGNFLNAALGVAKGSDRQLAVAAVNQLIVPLNSTSLNLGQILKADLANSEAAKVNLRLGDLALAAILAGADGRAVTVPLSLDPLGIDLRVEIVEPPQFIIGRKIEGKNPIAEGKTAQVKITLNSRGLSTPRGISGLLDAEISALNMTIYVQAGEVRAAVTDMQCKMPRSSNSTVASLTPTLASVCIGGPPSGFSNPGLGSGQCGGEANIATVKLKILLTDVTLQLAAGAKVPLSSKPTTVTMTGKAPQSRTVEFDAASGFSELLPKTDLRLNVNASLGSLRLHDSVEKIVEGLLGTLISSVGIILEPVLGTVGGLLDSVLELLGVSLVKSTLRLDNIDCTGTLLTR